MSKFLLVSRTRSHKNLEKVLCRLKTFSLVGDDMYTKNRIKLKYFCENLQTGIIFIILNYKRTYCSQNMN